MQRLPRRAAAIGCGGSAQRVGIGLFGTEAMADLSQMDADLVRPAGFEPALNQRVIADPLDRLHMGHRPLSVWRIFAGWR